MSGKSRRKRVSFNVPERTPKSLSRHGIHAPVDLVVEDDFCDESKEVGSLIDSARRDDGVSAAPHAEAESVQSEKKQPEKSGNGLKPRSSAQLDDTGSPVDDAAASGEDVADDVFSSDSECESGTSEDDEVDFGSPSIHKAEPESDDEKPQVAANGNVESLVPVQTFADMRLDSRVNWAIAKLGWIQPTPVQSYAVPAVLAGRDVLLSSPTGSGKTAAYSVPLANQICKAVNEREHTHANSPLALVVVPTRELSAQVTSHLRKMLKYVHGVKVVCVTAIRTKLQTGTRGEEKMCAASAKRSRGEKTTGINGFSRHADVLVGTPTAVAGLRDDYGEILFQRIAFVVLDEADLILSFGHGSDTQRALAAVPPSAQAMLVSATLDAEGLPELRKVLLRNPLTIKVNSAYAGKANENDKLSALSRACHYFARLKRAADRYLVTYAMLRLNVISGKVLIFASSVNSSFRLKLFLDQFRIRSAVLNGELPANSRIHCVEQYNSGVFDILIATDEIQPAGAADARRHDAEGANDERHAFQEEAEDDIEEMDDSIDDATEHSSRKKPQKRAKKDAEFGVARGVDFRGVAAVINFDLPQDHVSYTHRAGRTARAGASGTVLSLAVCDADERALRGIGSQCGVHIGPLAFRMDQVEAFRYRVEDCLRSVTDAAVREARLTEVRREIINSDRLKDYFEENPVELDALKHDQSLAKNTSEHLARIPSYLLPPALRDIALNEPVAGRRSRGRHRNHKTASKRGGRKSNDPLKTFSASKPNLGSSRSRYRARHGVTKRKGKKRHPNRPKHHP